MNEPARPGTLLRGALLLALTLSLCSSIPAQIAGNSAYGQAGAKARAEQNERTQRVIAKEDLPAANTMFIDASVLMNVPADDFVAVFGIAHEGASPQEAADKMDATIKAFTDELKSLHIRPADIFVDYISEPKIYSYETAENVAREKLSGFELKKNVSVRFSDHLLLDKLLAAAARAHIYDLIKVDYIVRDAAAVHDRVLAEAAAVIKQKLARDEKLLGVRPGQPAIVVERPAVYYPTELYDSYTAAESESLSRPVNNQRYTVIQARRGRTFYFNGLDGKSFDKVINPIILEPVVQFTVYLKLRYEVPK